VRENQPLDGQAVQHHLLATVRSDPARGHHPQCQEAEGALSAVHRGKDIQQERRIDKTFACSASRARGSEQETAHARLSALHRRTLSGIMALSLSLSLSLSLYGGIMFWRGKKRGGLFGIGPGVGPRWQGGFVMCGDVWPHRDTFHSTASTPLQRRVPISGSSADDGNDGNDGSPEERECKWAGAGVHRPARSHASFCLRLYLVDKESREPRADSGQRTADSGRENATIRQSTRPRLP